MPSYQKRLFAWRALSHYDERAPRGGVRIVGVAAVDKRNHGTVQRFGTPDSLNGGKFVDCRGYEFLAGEAVNLPVRD